MQVIKTESQLGSWNRAGLAENNLQKINKDKQETYYIFIYFSPFAFLGS